MNVYIYICVYIYVMPIYVGGFMINYLGTLRIGIHSYVGAVNSPRMKIVRMRSGMLNDW